MQNYNLINKIKLIMKTENETINSSISEVLLKHLNGINKLTISKLAQEANCSKSSVINYCKRMGLTGYKELIQILVFEVEIMSSTLAEDNFKESNIINENKETLRLTKYQKLIHENIVHISKNEANNIIKAAQITKNAKRIFLIGKGANLNILNIFNNYLIKLNYWSIFSQDLDVQEKYHQNVTKDDVIYIFSYSGITRQIIDIYNEIKKTGAQIILITSNMYSPMYDKENTNILVLNNEEVLRQQRNSVMSFMFIIMEIIYLLTN